MRSSEQRDAYSVPIRAHPFEVRITSSRNRRIERARTMKGMNLAGRAGRWSARHWKTAAFGWIAVAVLAVLVGGAVGARQMKSWAIANGDSRRAAEILDQANFNIPARESVLVQSRTATVHARAFQAAVRDV